MKLLLSVVLLLGCSKHVSDPASLAYRIQREDGAVLIVQYQGNRTLEELRDEFCEDQVCLMELVRLNSRTLIK